MTIESTRADLLAIEEAHQEDHDGGYRLASALCDYRDQMSEGSTNKWDEVLGEWVRDGSTRFWGVALEALARAGGPGVNDELVAMIRELDRGLEWREYITHTLIRRGFSNSELAADVVHAAKHMTPMGLPNLAALLTLIPELVSSAAACIVAALSSGKHGYVEANIPPLVYAAADSDPELLVRLVQQTQAADREAGEWLGKMLAEFLGRPFVQRRFAKDRAAKIAEILRRKASN